MKKMIVGQISYEIAVYTQINLALILLLYVYVRKSNIGKYMEVKENEHKKI